MFAESLGNDKPLQQGLSLETLFDKAPALIAMIRGAEYRFVYANLAFRSLMGERELVGLPLGEAAPELLESGLLRHIQTVLRDQAEVSVSEQPIVLSDATNYFDLSLQPLLDENNSVVGVILFGTEVTPEVLQKQALQESEERFRLLADNISQLAWMADETGWIFWYNKRWYDYTGTTLEQMQGWGWKAVHHPDHIDRVVEKLQRSWDTGEAWEDTFPLRCSQGEYRWYLSRALPIRDRDGVIVRWFGTNTDVTAQLEAEQELRMADRKKDEFLATLAHELRNPLAPLRSGLELMEVLEGQPDKMREVRQTMLRQTEQLVVLVDELLDISRLTRGTYTLRKSSVKLQTVLSDAVALSRPLLKAAGQTLKLSILNEDVFLNADSHRLVQVFGNLLNNASKYSPPGDEIHLTAALDGSDIVVSISDRGVGVAPEMQETIFEMFAQVRRPKRDGYGGLGVGLTLVKALVEMHSGRVMVQSEGLGCGSTFTVRLPIVEAPSGRSSETEPVLVESTDWAGMRVLVVDDNRTAAKFFQMILESDGHEVRQAGDGEEGCKLAEELRPHIVFMDIGMPKMNGYEAARWIRKQPWGEALTLVAVSGWGQEADKAQAREAGFDHHLTKPAPAREVRRIVLEVARTI